MFKTFFKVLFRILMAMGVIYALLALLKYLDGQQADYIEIYNDEDDSEEELY